MKPIGDSLYECVYLQGHPALTSSNSDEPPGSYHSRDVFTPHPTIPNRWKYRSRLDDRVVLLNGEKVLPLPIEGCIKQSPLIQEAVVFGVGETVPGLLVFRSDEARQFSDKEYMSLIWPAVEDANSRAEQFSQISRDMVIVLPSDSVCPRTDKGSMIRAQVYARYDSLINEMYTRVEHSADGSLEMSLDETRSHLMSLCLEELDFPLSSVDGEFFAEGMDSLKAMHLRRLILRDFRIEDSKRIGQNVAFETGTVSRLAEQIVAVQSGQDRVVEDEVSIMPGLIERYSTFYKHTPDPTRVANTKSVVLTGATGSMGAHILHKLLNDDSVSAVYCLTRRSRPTEAVLDALAQKGLSVLPHRQGKIIALNSALDQPDLGLHENMLNQIKQSASLIIHTAWPVNFNLPLLSFEPHIKGVHNLINLSLSVTLPSPAVMLFCSSISTALGASSRAVDETPINDLTSALEMGYGRSKLIGEHIVSNARQAGARAFTLRIGQVSGHSKRGLWNDSEAIPLMIRSALTLQALPELDTTCSWLPVDKLACSMLEIAKACAVNSLEPRERDPVTGQLIADTVYNLTNSRTFSWSDMLGALRGSGFRFETVSFDRWLDLMRDSEARGEEAVNPAVKLVEHYQSMYSEDSPAAPDFLTEKAERDSVTLRNGRLRIIQDGILGRYAQDWLRRWTTI